MQDVEVLIEKLVIESADFTKFDKLFDRFCPFEATGMVRQELRHGHFLSYMLDPNRPHGFGDECLRAFLMSLAKSTDNGRFLSPLEIHTSSWDDARVLREWKRIDLLIEVPSKKLIVAIELKLDSGEHGDQLNRYAESVQASWPEWKHAFVFLTKTGKPPGGTAREKWTSLHLGSVVDGFDEAVRKDDGVAVAHGQLGAYIDMTRRHHLEDGILEELAAELWSRHKEALEYLMDRRPEEGVGNVFGEMSGRVEQIAQAISKATELSIVCDNCTSAFLRFGVSEWDQLAGMMTSDKMPSGRVLFLEAQRQVDSIGMRIVLGPGNSAIRETIFQALRDANLDMTVRTLSPVWSRIFSMKYTFETGDLGDTEKLVELAEHELVRFFGQTVNDINSVIQTALR